MYAIFLNRKKEKITLLVASVKTDYEFFLGWTLNNFKRVPSFSSISQHISP